MGRGEDMPEDDPEPDDDPDDEDPAGNGLVPGGVLWSGQVGGRRARSPLGEKHDAAPAERYSAKAVGMQPGGHVTRRPQGSTPTRGSLFPPTPTTASDLAPERHPWVSVRAGAG
nr:hypothetical protein GCM10020241_10980 [Streptoalloteichus tenebrarius]